ncbi:MAG: nucleotidyltransferase family protein [Proteobacteria bacterium]|nr:nucleotidyltransferase family protein [Pseudomonadota bacterium]
MFYTEGLKIMQPFHSDPYRFQRLALLATEDSLPINKIRIALQSLSEVEQQQLYALIIKQGLQFFWLESLHELPDLPFVSVWRKTLKEQCFKDTTRYLAQKKAIFEVDRLFTEENIPYAIFKGAHIREVIYRNPAFRSSADIDLLVSPNDKIRAIHALCSNGYNLIANLANVSNEVSLIKDNVHLDLHWHIMRPGRTRVNLTDHFLQSRQKCDFFWALDNEMTLLVLLTHPVFTEYSTGPHSSIVKLADLRRWITKEEINWQRLLYLLEGSGMKTAAWITATLLADLTEYRLPASIFKALRPKKLKRFLLQQWLDLNLSLRFTNYPNFPKYIFTLLAHDSLNDILRFIRIFRAIKRKDAATMEQLVRASRCK